MPNIPNPVLFGNSLSLEADRRDHTRPMKQAADAPGPCAASRAMALTHVAMADVCAAFGASYEPFQAGAVDVPDGASKPAAIAAAAHAIVSNIYSTLQPKFYDQDFQAYLAELAAAGDSGDIGAGRKVGEAVALLVLGSREGDRASQAQLVDEPGNPPPDAAEHYVDPFHPGQKLYGARWGETPAFVPAAGQVSLPAPPDLRSEGAARDVAEVARLGGVGNSERTQDQEQVGVFWSYDGSPGIGTPPRLYNQHAVAILARRGVTEVDELARQLALVNLAMVDAGIVCWRAKYQYRVARPVRYLNEGNLNDQGGYEAGSLYWEPLGAQRSMGRGAGGQDGTTVLGFSPPDAAFSASGGGTGQGIFADPAKSERTDFSPNFPAYPSGHATFGAAAFGVLQRLGTDAPGKIELASDEYNCETRDSRGHTRPAITMEFDALSDAIQGNSDSRVFLGVHWAFDSTNGQAAGEKIAEAVVQNAYREIPKNGKG